MVKESLAPGLVMNHFIQGELLISDQLKRALCWTVLLWEFAF